MDKVKQKPTEQEELARRVALDFEELYVSNSMKAGTLPESVSQTLKNSLNKK